MDFEIVSKEECTVVGDREEMYGKLEQDLISQVSEWILQRQAKCSREVNCQPQLDIYHENATPFPSIKVQLNWLSFKSEMLKENNVLCWLFSGENVHGQ